MCTALGLIIGSGASLSVALPSIAAALGASQLELSYVVNGYALVFAGLLLPIGLAADRYSRRGFLVAGLIVFGTATLASGFANDVAVLIGLRGLAGLGAAAVMPATLSVLVDAYPPERRTFAVSVWAGVSGAASILGIVLCGVLLELFWWGSIQVVLGGAALVVAVPALVLTPSSRNPDLPLDPSGGVLAFLGLSGVVLGVIEGPERGWTTPTTLFALGVGLLGLVAFVVVEARSAHPLLDVRLFRRPGLALGSSLVLLQFVAAMAVFFLVPQFLQFVTALSALGAALSLLPLAVGIVVASGRSPAVMARFGAARIASAGMAMMAVSLLGLGAVGDGALYWLLLLLLLFGAGFGTAVTPGTQLIIDGLPEDRRTLSAAVNDVTREVGGALGGALAASVLLAVYGLSLSARELGDDAAAAAGEGVAGALAAADRLGSEGAQAVLAAQASFSAGYSAALYVAAGVLAVGAVLPLILKPERADTPDVQADPQPLPG